MNVCCIIWIIVKRVLGLHYSSSTRADPQQVKSCDSPPCLPNVSHMCFLFTEALICVLKISSILSLKLECSDANQSTTLLSGYRFSSSISTDPASPSTRLFGTEHDQSIYM